MSAQRKSVSSRTTKARAVPPDANASAASAIEDTAKRIRRLLDAHTRRDSAVFYKVGVQVRELDKSYGSGAIESLAASLGRDDSTLRSYARVATAWPNESEFMKLSSQRTADGRLPLCFTSFVVISSLEDPNDRQRMFERALTESLSSRDLKAAIADFSHDAGKGEDERPHDVATGSTTGMAKTTSATARQTNAATSRHTNAAAALSEIIRSHENQSAQYEQSRQALDKLSGISGNETLAKQLKKALECARASLAQQDAIVRLLETELGRVENELNA